MTTLEYIIKHDLKQPALAKMLGMSITGFRSKLHGAGKAKPFTKEEIDVLFNHIQLMARDARAVQAKTVQDLRSEIEAKGGETIREYHLGEAA